MNTKEHKHIQKTLTPILLKEGMPGFQTVLDIESKLDNPEVFNIAITGPYGSGKSTVLKTLQARDSSKKHKYLTVSLASLTGTDWESPDKTMTPEEQRRIEYSILQQLIYRETPQTLPNSRFRRLEKRSIGEAIRFGLAVIAFLVSVLIVFEPKWLRVESLCSFFNFGAKWNLVADGFCSLIILFCISWCAAYLFRRSGFHRIKSLNVKNLQIELNQEASVFNKHLEEIIYFFEATDYDVVIIEDLDRFRCSEIFQKLREINFILRKSEVIKTKNRVVKFIYAIKDDLFTDSFERTKFFDYIATVTPVVNPDNSFDKLSAELEERGYSLNKEKLKELSEFVDDMRMLKNIANEFQQYMDRISATSYPDMEKLLGMIIYKNHHPDDFGELHYQQGKVYEFISKKERWANIAMNKVIKDRRDILEQKRNDIVDTQRFNMLQWRMMYIKKYEERLPSFMYLVVNQQDHSSSDIYNDESLFNVFIENSKITYKYQDPYYSNRTRSETKDISLNLIAQDLGDNLGYLRRKQLAEQDLSLVDAEIIKLNEEENKLKSLKLSDLLLKFPEIQEDEEFKKIGLDNLMIRFLLRGYIDETYYDYLSIYDGKEMSIDDRRFLSLIKQNGPDVSYDRDIDDVALFVEKLPLFVYDYKCVLNYHIADYLENNSVVYKNALGQFENQFLKSSFPPLDFLAGYYLYGGSGVNLLWEKYVAYYQSWQQIQTYELREYWDTLVEAWLHHCQKENITEQVRYWLNTNLGFCVERLRRIGVRHLKDIISGCKFVEISPLGPVGDIWPNEEVLLLADYILDNQLFELNANNVFTACAISSPSFKRELGSEFISLSDILNSDNEGFKSYVKNNISEVFKQILSVSKGCESENGLLFIINNDQIEGEVKFHYLMHQSCRIRDIQGVDDNYKEVAINADVVEPTWENVLSFFAFDHQKIYRDFESFINRHCDSLIQTAYPSEGGTAFANEVVFGNCLEWQVYQKLAPILFRHVSSEGEDKLNDSVGAQRMQWLVMNNYLSANVATASIVAHFPGEVFAEYVTYHYSTIINHYDDYDLDAITLSVLLSKESRLSYSKKFELASMISDSLVESNSILSERLITLMWGRRTELEWGLVQAALKAAPKSEELFRFQDWIIRQHRTDPNKVSFVLASMASPFCDIIDYSKRPLIPTSFKEILGIIQELGIISSYKEVKNGLRVFHGVKDV